MRVLATIGLVGILGCAGGADAGPGGPERLAGCEAELAMKSEKISLLELVVDRQHELLEVYRKKERLGDELARGSSAEAREERIRALRWQLETAASQLIGLETRFRETLENQRRHYEGRMEELKARVAQLEQERAGKN
jgi:hypothetical protein